MHERPLGVRHAADREHVLPVDEAEPDRDVHAPLAHEVRDRAGAEERLEGLLVALEAVVEAGVDVEAELAFREGVAEKFAVAGGDEAFVA